MAGSCGAGSDLDRWLAPFLDALGHKRRRTWAPLYLRGLMGTGERKSLQPMAARLGLSGHDQLHHFIASPAWDDGPLWRVLAERADRLLGGPEAVLVIDDTALPKKGELSVGVARQYCGALGKRANCQVLVSLTLARGEVPIPVGLRLFLPDEWTADPARCAAAGVPEAEVVARAKGAIALAELDRLRASGVRFGTVLADAGYGASAAFRHGLDERQLLWAVGIPRTQMVYTTAVRLRWPRARTGRPRKTPLPNQEPRAVEAVLAVAKWRRVTWRQGTKGALAERFAAIRVRVADGPTTRTGRHLPGDEVWLIGEWRSSGERKYYLSNLPPDTPKRALAAAVKARWVCEQAHQQLKQELGLGHFEGRSWTGLHRHALMTCIAFTYLQHLRLKAARGRGKNEPGPLRLRTAAAAQLTRHASRHHGPPVCASRRTSPMSTLREPVPATT
ncbi:IS701 family transposase [Roseomonas chloroacetimidivorans]|uniref:IS701 family transposase n=1 Tax=Roseomonas chloroacetimidivorans TaxID=1766656 RepID=UPI003C72D4E0